MFSHLESIFGKFFIQESSYDLGKKEKAGDRKLSDITH